MPSLRLLADDLTGALDTVAELVGAFGPLSVAWSAATLAAGRGSFALDTGTRELGADEAFAVVQGVAPWLAGADIAYKKIDSLLRGPWVAELDACLRSSAWDACIIAPAFPYQGRRTRDGQQYARGADGRWTMAGDGIIAQLSGRGLAARLANPAAGLREGISLFDAETDEDLGRIVEIGQRFAGRLLWCGSGGLAGALARGTDVAVTGQLKKPVLGIFGSDHPATSAQLVACGPVVIRSADARSSIDRIRTALDAGLAIVRLETPGPHSRPEAAAHFSREIMRLAAAIGPPATLLVAGGETLKAKMLALGAQALQVVGRLEPGLPKSVIQGGPWAGVEVISKSGAFGPPDLWLNLLRRNGLI